MNETSTKSLTAQIIDSLWEHLGTQTVFDDKCLSALKTLANQGQLSNHTKVQIAIKQSENQNQEVTDEDS